MEGLYIFGRWRIYLRRFCQATSNLYLGENSYSTNGWFCQNSRGKNARKMTSKKFYEYILGHTRRTIIGYCLASGETDYMFG